MESDFLVALRLQQEMDKESLVKAMNKSEAKYGKGGNGGSEAGEVGPGSDMSLVDEAWELMDPNPNIHALFLQFDARFFNGRLAGVEVRWSPRMTLCAGLCCYEGHGGLCSVRLSQPLLKLRPRKDLIETLLHEMIHAYLFVTANNRDHDAHGPEFHKHMYRINREAGTNISVYHNFHDEVDHHRQHWWRCDGVCRSHPPYFGYVKRAMNRAPHPRDPWWPDHQRKCGGTYTKVKEPENYKKKQNKDSAPKKESASAGKNTNSGPDIRNFFGGKTEGEEKSKPAVNWRPVPGSSNKQNNKQPVNWRPEPGSSNTQNNKQPVTWRPEPGTSNKQNNKDTSPSSLTGNSVDGGRKPGEFPGTGFSLKKEWSGSNPHKIVRKIPGIGVIECERPSHPPLSVSNHDNSQKRKHSSPDSDSETDDILDKLRTKAKAKAKQRKVEGLPSLDRFLKATPGRSKKISGFQSVCSTNAPMDGEITRKPRSNKPSDVPRTPVRERDRRAINLGSDSSESDEDEEENRSLGSAIRSPKNSKSDPDYSPTDSRSATGKPSASGNNWLSVKKKVSRDDRSEDKPKARSENRGEVSHAQPAEVSHRPPGTESINEDPMRQCPSCMAEVRESLIHSHLDMCLQMF